MLYAAAALIVLIGIAHSVLGEKYILIRLFRQNTLPKLYGGTDFTRGTLRFAWHITTLSWWGFAAFLVLEPAPSPVLLYTTSMVFLGSAAFSAWFTRGKHFSWYVFLTISALTALSA